MEDVKTRPKMKLEEHVRRSIPSHVVVHNLGTPRARHRVHDSQCLRDSDVQQKGKERRATSRREISAFSRGETLSVASLKIKSAQQVTPSRST